MRGTTLGCDVRGNGVLLTIGGRIQMGPQVFFNTGSQGFTLDRSNEITTKTPRFQVYLRDRALGASPAVWWPLSSSSLLC